MAHSPAGPRQGDALRAVAVLKIGRDAGHVLEPEVGARSRCLDR